MAHKDFDAARKAVDGDSIISFTVGGENFIIPQPVPFLPLLDLAAAGDDDVTEMEAASAFAKAIYGLLDESDKKRFQAACTKARADTDLLSEIIKYVMGEVNARPTRPQSDLPGLRSTNGTTSSTEHEGSISTSSESVSEKE